MPEVFFNHIDFFFQNVGVFFIADCPYDVLCKFKISSGYPVYFMEQNFCYWLK